MAKTRGNYTKSRRKKKPACSRRCRTKGGMRSPTKRSPKKGSPTKRSPKKGSPTKRSPTRPKKLSLAERRRAKLGKTMSFSLPTAHAHSSPGGMEDDTHEKEELDALFERATMAAKSNPQYDPGQDTKTLWEPGRV